MKQFVTTMQYVFAAMGGAIGAVLSLILSRAEKYFLRWKVNR